MVEILLLLFLVVSSAHTGEMPKEIALLQNLLGQIEKEGLPQEYFFNKIRQAQLKKVPPDTLKKTLINDFEKMKEARNLLTRISVSGQKIQNYQNSLIFLTELLQRGLKPVDFLYFFNSNRPAKFPVDELLYFLEQSINLQEFCGFSEETSQELISNFYQHHQSYEPLQDAIEKIVENNISVGQHPQITELLEKFSRKQISWHKFVQKVKELSRETMINEIKK